MVTKAFKASVGDVAGGDVDGGDVDGGDVDGGDVDGGLHEIPSRTIAASRIAESSGKNSTPRPPVPFALLSARPAANVFGPKRPSTTPGSNPKFFSVCW